MTIEERKEKIGRKLEEIRKEASALQDAIEREEDDRRAAQRTFAAPKTSEEAEGDFPTLEELAGGYYPEAGAEGRPRLRTRDEILRKGTIIEKLRLYFSNRDLEGYFNTEGKLSDGQKTMIAQAISNEEDRRLVNDCYREVFVLTKYGTQLRYFFKRFQTSFSMLAELLNRWDAYEFTAEQMTKLYAFMEEPAIELRDIKEEGEPGDGEEARKAERLQAIARKKTFSFTPLEGARLRFDKATGTFSVYVGGKDGLYAQIKEEAKNVKEDLADFKAFVKAAEEYIEKSRLHFMPISIQMCIENAEEERFARYLVKNLAYFRSELNERRARGEEITKRDETKAVIPDFFEVRPTRIIYTSCKKLIKQLTEAR